MYIVVTGPPASGKSTLAPVIAAELGLPLLSKDTIKAGLVESLGARTLDESRRLGRAAVRALLALAGQNDGGVLDSVWVDREQVIAELTDLPGQVVEVFCRCERGLLEERYAVRGHDFERPAHDLWNDDSLRPLAGPWPVVEVDTTGPVERFSLLERVLVDGDAAAHGLDLGDRALEPIAVTGDRGLMVGYASGWVRTLLRAGYTPQPFGVVVSLRGQPEVVAPSNWLSGPPDWKMGWGDAEGDDLVWARAALERTSVRHRASALVSVDAEAGVLRFEVRHRTGDRIERCEVAL